MKNPVLATRHQPTGFFQRANIEVTRYFAKKKQQFHSSCSILCIIFYFRANEARKTITQLPAN